MKRTSLIVVLVLFLCMAVPRNAVAEPPFTGTIFIEPNIITEDDPTAFASLSSDGRGQREMFDRRIANSMTINAWLFTARFHDEISIEFQVNPEFGSEPLARQQAAYYAPVLGRLPRALRKRIRTVMIHQGDEPFGGNDKTLLIHVGRISQQYIDGGILEETLIHEASHASLDLFHAYSGDWFMAQTEDANFISSYARDFRIREDVAESFLPWLALRYRRDRMPDSLARTIEDTIPNRLAYFDRLDLDLSLMEQSPAAVAIEADRMGTPVVIHSD